MEIKPWEIEASWISLFQSSFLFHVLVCDWHYIYYYCMHIKISDDAGFWEESKWVVFA